MGALRGVRLHHILFRFWCPKLSGIIKLQCPNNLSPNNFCTEHTEGQPHDPRVSILPSA